MGLFRFLGNIVWFILYGFISGLAWLFIGLLWCITIVGIPVGIQCFKLSCVSFFPFGKNILLGTKTSSVILNILWIVFGGLELALGYLAAGILFCCTIIGIPLGLQCFKLVKLSFLPFGAKIEI
ncbi:YccF domain-containing protein [uncultured Treponema sp.]|uniref:YccF domain-containing protein n=1 Tax=uncultured Treponema sp. TaxID=162155 RepID=UPI00280B0AC0|nr:YccF domain-containing protein [uncultured Treponema sp.]